MRILIIGLYFLSLSVFSLAQYDYTWAEDIAPVIYSKCAHCHHEGAIGGFSLMSYDDVYDWAYQIHHVIEEKEMPPWPADPEYRHFANEFPMDSAERQMIIDWYHDYLPTGDMSLAPLAPEFPEAGTLLETIDYVVAIEPYTLQTNNDEYRWFVVPTDFTDTVYLNKIEVFAGLESVVHHADLAFDMTGATLANDLADPLPGFNNFTGTPTYSHYINAWQPGGNIARYPDGWGVAVPPGADFVVEIHYGPGGIGQVDSTYMNLEFVNEEEHEEIRPVSVSWYLNQSPGILIDGPLFIPANEIVTFHQISNPLPYDMSLISICPHMHGLGKSYKVWAITPSNDSIPLIDIPQWDFHWQRYYTYPTIQYLPQGTVLYSEGVYDNTSANHDNPNSPPIDVSAGLNTTDEMFLTYIIFAPYQEGDDTISMEIPFELIQPQPTGIVEESDLGINIYPNPTSDKLDLSTEFIASSIEIVDANGRLVFREIIHSNEQSVSLKNLNEGCYILSILRENVRVYSEKLLIQR